MAWTDRIKPLIGAIISFLVVLGTVLLIWQFLSIQDPLLTIIVFLTPIVVYLVLDGKLASISGPGFEARFAAAAKQRVGGAYKRVGSLIEPVNQDIEKAPVDHLEEQIANIDPSRPLVLTLRMGQDYSAGALMEYVRSLVRLRGFVAIIVLDETGRLVGWIRPSELLVRGGGSDQSQSSVVAKLIAAVAEHEVDAFVSMSGWNSETVSTKDHAVDALQAMIESGEDVFVVVDENSRFKGVIRLEELIAQIMVDMTENP